MEAHVVRTPQELRENIAGVVVGLPTLFNGDYSINYDGMKTHIDFLVDSGVNVLMLSRGISEWSYLTYEEIKAVTRNVAEAVAGRVPFITSTFDWWTGQAIDFAKYARDVGADGCLIVLPPLFTSYDPLLHDAAFYAHFEAIAQATDLGLLIHERNLFGWGGGSGSPLSVSLVDRLADIDSVVGMKLEGGDRLYSHQVVRKTRDRLAIIGDWGPEAWLFSHEYGVGANIADVGQFAPAVEIKLWDDIRAGRLASARTVINDVITRYYVAVVAIDWVAACKASMEFVGLPGGPMRSPNSQLTVEQKQLLRLAMVEAGLLK
jgi:dihydrodipicolinate synthase/N-acetylneuraminate lyase